MPFSRILRLALLIVLVGLVFAQILNAGLGLLCGLVFGLTVGNPVPDFSRKLAGQLLKISVVGLGFGLDLQTLWSNTQDGIWLTVSTIFFALGTGLLLGRLLGVEGKLSALITTGTSICGGSAIAAMAPTIEAKPEQTLVSISIVFILNGIALYVYPWLGHALDLSQQQFGLWAALGIHDTSSVVGAASMYGEEALKIATTTKLARALWIIPLVLGVSLFVRRGAAGKSARVKIPYFIFLFILASGVATLLPSADNVTSALVHLAKIGLVLSLLLMGTGLTRELIRTLDLKPLIQGLVLWVLVSCGSLLAILHF